MTERYRSILSGLVYRVIAEPVTWKGAKPLVVFQSEVNYETFVTSAEHFFHGGEFVRHATLDDLDDVQGSYLLTYAAAEGPNWKENLNALWQTGRASPPLQQIRNNLGPSWLDALVI